MKSFFSLNKQAREQLLTQQKLNLFVPDPSNCLGNRTGGAIRGQNSLESTVTCENSLKLALIHPAQPIKMSVHGHKGPIAAKTTHICDKLASFRPKHVPKKEQNSPARRGHLAIIHLKTKVLVTSKFRNNAAQPPIQGFLHKVGEDLGACANPHAIN